MTRPNPLDLPNFLLDAALSLLGGAFVVGAPLAFAWWLLFGPV
jgi:hypothetical protein